MSANALVPRAVDLVAPVHSMVIPTDPARAHASGPAPYRVVVVGGSPVAGHGVTTHELGLSGSIARRVAGLTGHGVDVDAVPLGGSDARTLGRALQGRDLTRVDGLVLVIDAVAIDGRGEHVRRLHRLLVELRGTLTPTSSITVAVVGGSDIDEAELCGGMAPLAHFLRLDELQSMASARERYAVWGESIAAVLAGSLGEPLVWSDPVEDLDEHRRSAVVRRLGPFDRDWEAMLERLVRSAVHAYGVESGAVTVIDGSRARYLAPVAVAASALPRTETICETALHTYGGILVGDAQADRRFQDLPLVRSGVVRFYAGYRIDSSQGVPIAVLCVFDSQPREVRGQDISLLRDFAHLAERRIREYRRRAG